MNIEKFPIGRGMKILLTLVVIGFLLAIIRFAFGLGAVTNLNNGYPWGLWIGFDVLSGVALAAGGFTMAATVYIFQLKKYHPIVRPAILTGFLGYLLVIVALLIDLGRPYRLWHPMVFWQPASPMFEVAWCVMLYTLVLALEFSPAVFERFGMEGANRIIKRVTVVLVIAGVILSTLHQSSLGTLFLIIPHKLNSLWYTPILPILFFVSAVAVGLSMVIFEAMVSAKIFRRGLELELLSGLGKAVPYVLALYLFLKVADLIGRGAVDTAFTLNVQSVLFWIEVSIGVMLPMVLLIHPEVYNSKRGLFWSSLCVIGGVILNRLNVGITGIHVMTWESYFPSWMEFAVTIGVIALGLVAFSFAVRYLPIFAKEEGAVYAHG